jgi:hypothetical protein
MTATIGDTNGAIKYYKYPFSQKVITYLLMPLVSLISVSLGSFLLKADDAILGSFFTLVGVGLFFLSAFGSLMCSPIIVSDEGIEARNFGRMLKFVRWEEVTKIKKVRRWNAGSRSFDDTFYVFNGNFPALRERMVNLRGPIAFGDKISGIRDLLNGINEYGQRHHLLFVTLDQEHGSDEFRVTEF